jgi:hypothetical protein
MNRMHGPEKRDEQRQALHPGAIKRRPKTRDEQEQEPPDQKSAQRVIKDIRNMVAERVLVPQQVVEHVGPVLHRPVIAGERIEKEVMPEDLEKEDWALEKRITADEKSVVPDKLATEDREVSEHRREKKEQEREPFTARDFGEDLVQGKLGGVK